MPGRIEFVAMMSLLMGLIAIGIDLMLPALSDVAADVGQQTSADVASIVTTYFVGLALGQMVWGPLADRFGRKRALNIGLSVIIVASVTSALVSSLPILLATRFVWGFGASAARSTTLTVVRDRFRGDRMASVMSLIFSVFILVPVVAPTLGAGLLTFTSWRGLFAGIGGLAVVLVLWLRRLPETLEPDKVRSVRPRDVWASIRTVFRSRLTVGYLLVLTALSIPFTAWIALSEPVVVGIYDLEAAFPLIFGGLAATMALASLVNSRVVERFGARRLVRVVMTGYCVVTAGLMTSALLSDGVPPFWILAGSISLILMSHALLQSNAQSLAMDPMGEVAGIASAVIGAVSLGVGTGLGYLVQVAFGDRVTPIAIAFLLSGVVGLALVWWAEPRGATRPVPADQPEPATAMAA